MKNRQSSWLVVVAAIAWLPLVGCDSSGTSSEETDMDAIAAMLDQPKRTAEPAREREEVDERSREEREPPDVERESVDRGDDMEQAREVTARDPKRGQRVQKIGGYLGATMSARFIAEHQVTFNSVKHALDLYNATNGHFPKTHDEFMREIIQANYIELPRLRDGYEYIYDPADHTLKQRPVAEE